MPNAADDLRAQLDDWAHRLLQRVKSPPRSDGSKIIRDPVHGYIVLQPHEVAIVDTPFLQRLRHIHQTALAYLVYPGATHTRFEHTLGVLQAVTNMARALRANDPEGLISDKTVHELRLAALLHDVGHVFFSHLGETILSDKFRRVFNDIKSDGRFQPGANEGELLAYFIITGPFGRYIESVLEHYGIKDIDLEKIAGYIIGKAADEELYKADMINGPFDTDKLDYLLRDCHFCGLRADVDAERLYHTVKILDRRAPSEFAGKKYLVVDRSAIPILEQILFNKMMLYTAIYHHQKVRALECMVKGIFETATNHPRTIRNSLFKFESVTDFFQLTEYDFFSLGLREPVLAPKVEAILDRQLLKRAFVISIGTVEGDQRKRLLDLDKLKTQPATGMLRLRRSVFNRIGKAQRTDLQDLWIDLPGGPDLNEEAEHCLVMVEPDSDPRPLSELFPSDEWLTSYQENKWTGHVFYHGERAHLEAEAYSFETCAAAPSGLGLRFRSTAREQAKL